MPRMSDADAFDLDNIDLINDVLPAAAVAELAGVTPARIRDWKRRGLLRAIGSAKGYTGYIPIDVLRVELATRQSRKSRRCLR